MVFRRVSSSPKWSSTESTTTSSPPSSPLESNGSFSPIPRKSLSVSALLNTGSSLDEVSQTGPSSPDSRLSTPPVSGSDGQSEGHQQVSVTLPSIDHMVRFAELSGALTPPATPSSFNQATATAPVAPRLPLYPPQPQLPYRPAPPPSRHQFYGQESPNPYSPAGSGSKNHRRARRAPTYAAGHTRNNRKYTREQVDFICYHHVDKKKAWTEVREAYSLYFPSEANRTASGLQGSFYRQNLQVPVTDHNNNLIFADDGTLQVKTAKVRDQAGNRIGLLNRYPNRAIEYEWVDEQDKRRIWHIGMKHRNQIAREHKRQQARQTIASPYYGGFPPSMSPPSSISPLSTTSPRL